MEFNVHKLSAEHDFVVTGVSYIGKPRPNTFMFVTRKVEHLVANLEEVSHCLVFAEKGIVVEQSLAERNCFVFSDTPQRAYANLAAELYQTWFETERRRRYVCAPGGYYVGENVIIGAGAYIEPGCLIGHDVIIGDNARIFAGAVIKKAVIGNDFQANEGAVIGTFGFTMTEDEKGDSFRIPTLGRVCIGNHVEIGANCSISCGSGGDTVIDDHVKIDALVYIGHDVHLHRNVELTGGNIIGGYTELEENVYMGFNCGVRNRIKVGKESFVGMGSTVVKNVEAGVTVAGNPARLFTRK